MPGIWDRLSGEHAQRVEAALGEIIQRLRRLETHTMAQAIRLDRLDAATNKIATVLQNLREKAVNGMTEAEVQRFDASIIALEGFGKDPENPLPEPTEPTEPAAPAEPGGGGQ